ncbi:MAG TPA: hotdog domain-containing protein [Solirubrobacteraceae bacterium]|nr:hotdog domain-containing protein [Solirubrobacteraceae bacterium]
MRFHLIDRIDSFEAFKAIRARKLTSRSEDYWEESGGELVMPPPFALEALCQAGTWLIMISTERRQRAALLSVGSVDWHRPVRPGDVLELSGEISSFGQDTAVVSGTVTVDGALVLAASDIMCALIDGGTLAADDDMARLQEMLTRKVEAA